MAWRKATFREFESVFSAIPPWPCDHQYLHCLGIDILEPPLWSWIYFLKVAATAVCWVMAGGDVDAGGVPTGRMTSIQVSGRRKG